MGLKYLHLLIKFQSYVMWELVPLWELVPFQTEDPGGGGGAHEVLHAKWLI